MENVTENRNSVTKASVQIPKEILLETGNCFTNKVALLVTNLHQLMIVKITAKLNLKITDLDDGKCKFSEIIFTKEN